MAKMMIATESFRIATKDGSRDWVEAGDTFPDTDRRVKARPAAFRDVNDTPEPYVRRAAPVEQATAGPGEVRDAAAPAEDEPEKKKPVRKTRAKKPPAG